MVAIGRQHFVKVSFLLLEKNSTSLKDFKHFQVFLGN